MSSTFILTRDEGKIKAEIAGMEARAAALSDIYKQYHDLKVGSKKLHKVDLNTMFDFVDDPASVEGFVRDDLLTIFKPSEGISPAYHRSTLALPEGLQGFIQALENMPPIISRDYYILEKNTVKIRPYVITSIEDKHTFKTDDEKYAELYKDLSELSLQMSKVFHKHRLRDNVGSPLYWPARFFDQFITYEGNISNEEIEVLPNVRALDRWLLNKWR